MADLEQPLDGESVDAGSNVSAFHGPPQSTPPKRLLVALPNWVGDIVLTTPALQALRTHFGNAHIAYLVKTHLAEILSGSNWMDELIFWPEGKGKSRPKRRQGFLGLAAELRKQQFDCAALMANSFRSALLARLAGIKRRVGYDRDGRGLLLTDRLLAAKTNGKYVPFPMIRYYNAIARYLGCRDFPSHPMLSTTEQEEAVAEEVIASAGIEPDRPIVVLNPGTSFGPAKCWPAERFAEVGDRLVTGRNAAVFISCGPKEVDQARKVGKLMRHQAVVLDDPILKLGPFKALLRRAKLLITNDTGSRHLANALGTPTVTIFGSTDPRWTQTNTPSERLIMVNVNCGPCMKRICPIDHRCMTRINSEMVLAPAHELLSGQA